MTGGQQAVGELAVPELARRLLAEGVAPDHRHHRGPEPLPAASGSPGGAEVRHRDRLLEAQEELAQVAGVTVLIHDQECAAEKRRERKRGKAPTRPSGS